NICSCQLSRTPVSARVFLELPDDPIREDGRKLHAGPGDRNIGDSGSRRLGNPKNGRFSFSKIHHPGLNGSGCDIEVPLAEATIEIHFPSMVGTSPDVSADQPLSDADLERIRRIMGRRLVQLRLETKMSQ